MLIKFHICKMLQISVRDLLRSRNLSIDPCDDFYQHACGEWIATRIPVLQNAESLFIRQETLIRSRIHDILEDSNDDRSEALTKAQTMYQNCMNQDEKEGIKRIVSEFKHLGGWPMGEGRQWVVQHQTMHGVNDLLPLFALQRRRGHNGLIFNVEVHPDLTDNSHQIVTFSQASPQRLYATKSLSDSEGKDLVHKLIKMVAHLNTELNVSNAEKDAEEMIGLNNRILENLQPIDTTNIKSAYVKMTIQEFSNATKINWLMFLNGLFDSIRVFHNEDKIAVLGIEYFKKLRSILSTPHFSPKNVINFELTKDVALQYSFFLQDLNQDPHHLFSSHCFPTKQDFLTSLKWLRCVMIVEICFDNVLAWKYSELYLDESTELKAAKDIAKNIFHVFSEKLRNLDWLDNSSRHMASEKLHYMTDSYLYPRWDGKPNLIDRYYDEFRVTDNIIDDIIEYERFRTQKKMEMLRSVSNMTAWPFPPLKVDAIYLQETNSMQIMEGIVQLPLFSPDRLQAMNYASLGTIIAHEITHGFDMQGIQFDRHGNLNPWMTVTSRKKFLERAKCFSDQYSTYKVTPEDLPGSKGFQVNGMKTLSENIADNGGIRQAYSAYKRWIQVNSAETLPTDDVSPEQLFFLAYARTWCTKYGQSSDLEILLSRDVHSPAKFRIIGPLSNFEEFSKVYNCSATSKMNRGKESCRLW